MIVVYANEEVPETITKSLFLAGPTPRNRKEQESWRPDALKILEDIGFDGAVFIPEPKEAKEDHDYEAQVQWEEDFLNIADCILFWVPRDLTPDSTGFPKMAAFTTNVEYGAWCDSGKVVFGCPEDAEKVSYLKHYAEKYKVPVGDTLTETLELALEMLGDGAERSGGERQIPLFIWNTPSFQSWYQSQKEVGNRLDEAKLLYNFRPGFKKNVFLWILGVKMWVESQQRHHGNEFVLSRTDISATMLWHKADPIEDSELVFIKEFRPPARTDDGFIREFPGGSSKEETDPKETAASEVYEETGFFVKADRIKSHGDRQLAGTLSSHHSFFYSVELTEKEVEWFKSQKGIVHGKKEDNERTFVEVVTVKEFLENKETDWSTLGMALYVLYGDENE
jgi:8-oxo-dGTP pyrophosphatase MutT (NUDIX family)